MIIPRDIGVSIVIAATFALQQSMVSPCAAADQITYRPDYVALLPGYSMPSKSYGTTGTGVTVSGIYGRQLSSNFSFEVNIQSSVFETGTAGGTDFYQNGGTLDLTYSLWDRRDAKFATPYLLAGIGGVYDDFFPNTRDGAAYIAEAGAGLVSRPLFSAGIRFRLDARYLRDGKEGGHDERRVLAGIEIPLGRIEQHSEYLPGKIEVREIVKEAAHPGVDSDGVDDDHGRCRNTPRGMKVDTQGCVIKDQIFALQGVVFDFNTARLSLNATTVLDLVSGAFVGQPSLKVEIAGHTDSVGSARANLELSQARADTVRAYLISKGALPEQLVAKGYGKSQLLINPEAGAADRERNRRVELRVLER